MVKIESYRSWVNDICGAFQVQEMTSPEMKLNLIECQNLYYRASFDDEENPCQRLPVVIVEKLTKAVFGEYDPAIEGNGGNREWLKEILKNLDAVRRKAMQYVLSGGEIFLKPMMNRNRSFDFLVVRRDRFAVLGRDSKGNITDVVTTETTDRNHSCYTLLERRTVLEDGRLRIINRLFRSADRKNLGSPCPLDSLEQYAELKEEYIYPEPFWNVGMIQMKTPCINTVDGSDDGVSVYSAAVGLIREVYRNEKQLDWEFENGESRIFASSDMFRRDRFGNRVMVDHVFTALEGDAEDIGVTSFSPTLRQESYIDREQKYLRNIENLIGLKRGLLSDVGAEERTATEITSSQGDFNLTVIDFQQMWERALKEALRTCELLGKLYELCSDKETDLDSVLSVDWGNGILYDPDQEWSNLFQMVQAGMLKPEIAIAWKYKIPCENEQDMEAIRTKYLPVASMMGE